MFVFSVVDGVRMQKKSEMSEYAVCAGKSSKKSSQPPDGAQTMRATWRSDLNRKPLPLQKTSLFAIF